MTDGRKVIKAFARDHEALQLDPVASHFQFNETGARRTPGFHSNRQEADLGRRGNCAFASTVPLSRT